MSKMDPAENWKGLYNIDAFRNMSHPVESTIEYDELSDEYILPIPDEILDSMGWVDGDELLFEIAEDNTIVLRREYE